MGQRNSWNDASSLAAPIPKRFVHKRIRWCTKSNRIAKAFRNQVDIESCEGDLLEDGAISDLDLKVAEHMFPFEQDKWQEIEQHCDDISGKIVTT